MPCNTSVGVVTQCYNDSMLYFFMSSCYALVHVYLDNAEPHAYIHDNYLVVSEEESAEVCIELSEPLMENVHVTVETSDNKSAVGRSITVPFCSNV